MDRQSGPPGTQADGQAGRQTDRYMLLLDCGNGGSAAIYGYHMWRGYVCMCMWKICIHISTLRLKLARGTQDRSPHRLCSRRQSLAGDSPGRGSIAFSGSATFLFLFAAQRGRHIYVCTRRRPLERERRFSLGVGFYERLLRGESRSSPRIDAPCGVSLMRAVTFGRRKMG